jgi:hypothetical protein
MHLNELDYLVADTPYYNRKMEILKTECFMLSHIIFDLRVKNYLENDSDYTIFEEIFYDLLENYLGDCLQFLGGWI